MGHGSHIARFFKRGAPLNEARNDQKNENPTGLVLVEGFLVWQTSFLDTALWKLPNDWYTTMLIVIYNTDVGWKIGKSISIWDIFSEQQLSGRLMKSADLPSGVIKRGWLGSPLNSRIFAVAILVFYKDKSRYLLYNYISLYVYIYKFIYMYVYIYIYNICISITWITI